VQILLFTVSCVYLLAFRRVVNMDPDEGIVLRGAHRILAGELPYRDFFIFYTPGSFYLTAALFRIFGDSILVARSALVFFGASVTVVAYALAKRTCSNTVALLTSALVLTTAAPYRFLVLHNWDSTFWACMAVYCAVRWSESSRWPWAFSLGTLASFTFLSEQSKGAGIYLGIFLTIFIFRACGRRVRSFRSLVVGLLWPILAVFAYFAWKHSLYPMLAAWTWPLLHYSAANRVPYGDQSWSDATRYQLLHEGALGVRILVALGLSTGFLVPALPLIGAGMLVHWARRLKCERDSRTEIFVLLCAFVAGLLVSVVLVRADINHFMYLSPLFYLPLAWILDSRIFSTRFLNFLRPFIQLYTGAAFSLLAIAVLFAALGAHDSNATRRGKIRSRAPDTVIEYVQAHAFPGQKLLIYPYLPLYNYLTDTQSPSRLDYFQPGMNTPAQAQEIIRSLQAQQVRSVLFEPSFADKIPSSWPETPLSAIANDPVADYILHNYRSCKFLKSPLGWQFEYMLRRDQPCP
jgi:4-amino-4-deoxy-L-arabinose transferase-like glycosyltransferase